MYIEAKREGKDFLIGDIRNIPPLVASLLYLPDIKRCSLECIPFHGARACVCYAAGLLLLAFVGMKGVGEARHFGHFRCPSFAGFGHLFFVRVHQNSLHGSGKLLSTASSSAPTPWILHIRFSVNRAIQVRAPLWYSLKNHSVHYK